MSKFGEWRVELASEFRETATQFLHFQTRESALVVYEEAVGVFTKAQEKVNDLPAVSQFTDGYGGVLAVETRRIGHVRLTCAGEYARSTQAEDLEHRKAVADLGLTLSGARLDPSPREAPAEGAPDV